MRKKEIVILVGNIGAGKSTLSKKYVKQGYRVISRDAIRYMVGSGSYTFDVALEPVINLGTRALLREFLKKEVNVVYDETNVSQRLRKPTIEVAKKYGYKVTAIELQKLSKRKSVNRRMKNPHGCPDRGIWEMVWERFDSIYESPIKAEGIDRIIKL